jgi:hypothetical protein
MEGRLITSIVEPIQLPEQVALLATGTRWSLRIPLATIFIVVERHWTTWLYLKDELLFRERESDDALMGRKTVPWIWRVAS